MYMGCKSRDWHGRKCWGGGNRCDQLGGTGACIHVCWKVLFAPPPQLDLGRRFRKFVNFSKNCCFKCNKSRFWGLSKNFRIPHVKRPKTVFRGVEKKFSLNHFWLFWFLTFAPQIIVTLGEIPPPPIIGKSGGKHPSPNANLNWAPLGGKHQMFVKYSQKRG